MSDLVGRVARMIDSRFHIVVLMVIIYQTHKAPAINRDGWRGGIGEEEEEEEEDELIQ